MIKSILRFFPILTILLLLPPQLLAGPPIVSARDASDVSATNAGLNARVNTNGTIPTDVYFEYGIGDAFDQKTPTTTINGDANWPVSVRVSGLTPGTTYRFRAVASNNDGDSVGDSRSFTTDTLAPVATTLPATEIRASSAILNADVNPNGESTTVQFEYGPVLDYETNKTRMTASPNTIGGTTTQRVTLSISGLKSATDYQFRVFATNSKGTARGAILPFKTSADKPVVVTNPADSVTDTSAILNGTVDPNGAESTDVFFQYGELGQNLIEIQADNSPLQGDNFQAGYRRLENLKPGTSYRYRIKAVSEFGESFGEYKEFLTKSSAASVVTLDATGITSNSATLRGQVNPNGSQVQVSFDYGTSENDLDQSVAGVPSPISGTSAISVQAGIDQLKPATTYYFRVKTLNDETGTVRGTIKSFTTEAAPPRVTETSPATNITATSALLNGSVNPNGASTTVQFEYGLTQDYGQTANADQNRLTGTNSQPVTAQLSGLTPNETYNFRIKASNNKSGSTPTFGQNLTFSTGAAGPTATTLDATDVLDFSAVLKGVVNPGGTDTNVFFDYGTASGNYTEEVTATGSPFSGTEDQAVSVQVSLKPFTTYYFRVRAKSAAGENVGDEKSFQTLAGLPTVSTSQVGQGDANATFVTLEGAVNPNGSTPTIAQFIYYIDRPDPFFVIDAENSPINDPPDLSVPVSAKVENLKPSTVYTYYAGAINGVGNTIGSIRTFTTAAATMEVSTNIPVENIGPGSASSGGSVTPVGSVEVTDKGVCWSIDENPTTEDSCTSEGGGSGSFSSLVTGLTPDTEYYLRAYGTDNLGNNIYGNELTFKTEVFSSAAINLLLLDE